MIDVIVYKPIRGQRQALLIRNMMLPGMPFSGLILEGKGFEEIVKKVIWDEEVRQLGVWVEETLADIGQLSFEDTIKEELSCGWRRYIE